MFPTSSSSIKIVPLGAGQDVGRSCVLVSMNGKNIMFDCGMHMVNIQRERGGGGGEGRTGKRPKYLSYLTPY